MQAHLPQHTQHTPAHPHVCTRTVTYITVRVWEMLKDRMENSCLLQRLYQDMVDFLDKVNSLE